MQIKKASDADIPAIVDLLKLSLGENLTPKSERYWRWKHVENPFGQSPVLLCYEGNTLVGVRAFMRWQWAQKGKIYHAVRAVDTATHPQYQGRGIFKKLTLSLLESCKEDSVDFVYNTPNEQSKPGYLKMGWAEAGKLSVAFKVIRPLKMVNNYLRKHTGNRNDIIATESGEAMLHPQLPKLLISNHHDQIVTNRSVEFLKWRYLNVPIVKYSILSDESNGELSGLLIFRIKESSFGKELRITDGFFNDSRAVGRMQKKLQKSMEEWRVDYCTWSASLPLVSTLFGGLNFKSKIGPIVTVRSVSTFDLSSLKNFKNWSPSLGDLELF